MSMSPQVLIQGTLDWRGEPPTSLQQVPPARGQRPRKEAPLHTIHLCLLPVNCPVRSVAVVVGSQRALPSQTKGDSPTSPPALLGNSSAAMTPMHLHATSWSHSFRLGFHLSVFSTALV